MNMWSHVLERLKNEWNNDRVSQNVFGMEWTISKRVAVLQDYVPNFLQIYSMISEDGEAVSILS